MSYLPYAPGTKSQIPSPGAIPPLVPARVVGERGPQGAAALAAARAALPAAWRGMAVRSTTSSRRTTTRQTPS